jgi:Rab GTPase-activating protein 1
MESKPNISPTAARHSEDNLSIKSSDSQTTSGEYEIVPVLQRPPTKKVATNEVTSPVLDIPNRENMDELEKNLTEVIFEQEISENDKSSGATPTTTFPLTEMGNKPTVLYDVDLKAATTPTSTITMSPASAVLTPDVNKVGQSVFYDCLDMSPLTEKQDKPEKSDTEEESKLNLDLVLRRLTQRLLLVSDIDQECTVFSGVTYLGAANINSPKNEPEIHRTMSELNAISGLAGLKVSVSIPTCSEGLVV